MFHDHADLEGGNPGQAAPGTSEVIGDPDVALAVDAESAAAVTTCLKGFRLARIGGSKPRDVVRARGIAHPDPVPLVDGEVKG